MRAGRRQLKVALWAICALSAACTEKPSAPPADEAPRAVHVEPAARAVVGKLLGEVSVKRAAGDDWIPAVEAMKLYDNDKLRTARGAQAEVRFSTGSRLTVSEDTLVGIAESQPMPGSDPSDITVLKGRIDAQLTDAEKQSLVVSTPAATVRAGREIVFK